jgi:hypothetical protein
LQRLEELLTLGFVEQRFSGCVGAIFAFVGDAVWAVLVVFFEDVAGARVAASSNAGGEIELVLETDQLEELPASGFSWVGGVFELGFEFVGCQVWFDLGFAGHMFRLPLFKIAIRY